MARIRTIKPEFPQSESMGRVSRDARLLFVQLWTIVDDEGRARGSSRILASLLYPYDDDALGLMDTWVSELEREGCVARYSAGNSTYIQILKWGEHQKIDKPSKSKLPKFDASSRAVESPREYSREPREDSSGDLDLDLDLEGKGSHRRAREAAPHDPDPPSRPTAAAAVCVAMRAAGLMSANPAHPGLLELLAQGATTDEFVHAAKTAVGGGKGFAYALAIVRGQRQDVARQAPSGPAARKDPADDPRWPALHQRAAKCGFRKPTPADTPETYETSLRLHEHDCAPVQHGAPRFA